MILPAATIAPVRAVALRLSLALTTPLVERDTLPVTASASKPPALPLVF